MPVLRELGERNLLHRDVLTVNGRTLWENVKNAAWSWQEGVKDAAWSWQEGWDLYALFWARGERPAPADVVLVPIDQLGRSRLYLPSQSEDFERCRDVRLDKPLPGYRNPDPPNVLTRWPRCLHARALDTLARAQPAAIVMDISFRPRSDPSGAFLEQDRTLAASIRKAGSVLLALNISANQGAGDQVQPIAGEIEAAALALAPFQVLGDQLKRADKFCTFKEGYGWLGPCLPTVAHQLTSLKVYPELRALLERAATKNVDLMPVRADALLADGSLQARVRLLRHLVTADPRTAERVSALLAAAEPAAASDLRRLRSLTDIYLGPGIRYFNFYGFPGAFQTLRYEALVAGDESVHPPAGSLRGKVVFIGFAEHRKPETSEHFTTPFTKDSIKLSGVELAATAYANLQDGSAIEPAPPAWRGLIALSLGILCTLLGVALLPRSISLGSLAIVALGCGYFAVALVVFERFALWLPVSPLGLDVIGGFAAGFVELKRRRTEAERQRAEAEQQRAEVERRLGRFREALGKLLPPRLVEPFVEFYEGLTELRETVYGACVFVDVERFTTKAESEPVDRVPEILNANLRALLPVVQKYGGEPLNHPGDAIVAAWSTVAPDASLRRRACAACLQLAEAAEQFRQIQPETAMPIRIGVEYGLMVLCMVGGPSHVEFHAVGDVPNTASRLQELNKKLGTRLLVSRALIDGLDGPGDFLARYVGHFTLHGKQQSTHVYQLIGERSLATREQLELCESFREALAAYQAADRQDADQQDDAQRHFEALRRQHADDGPTAYYAGLCAAGRYLGQKAIPAD